MKNLQYLSIQGRCAPSFWFKNRDAHCFRSLIESFTLSRALVLSSIYRTDILFCFPEDHTELILRLWCLWKEFPLNAEIKSKFLRTADNKEALEFYFDTLFHLSHHTHQFEQYRERLSEILHQEPDNAILNELISCDSHLTTYYCQLEPHLSLTLSPDIGKKTCTDLRDPRMLLAEEMNPLSNN